MKMLQGADLDSIVFEFDAFQKCAADLWKERMKLSKQLDLTANKLAESRQRENKLQNTVQSLQDLVLSAHRSLASKCDLEVENLRLKDELKAEESRRLTTEKEYDTDRKSMEQRLCDLSEISAAQLASQHQTLTEKFTAETEVLQSKIDQLTADIDGKKMCFMEFEHEKQEEMMRVRLEYETKLQKLHKQAATNNTPTTNQMSMAGQEIFRKKLQHVKDESDREIAMLRQKVLDLQRQLSTTASGQNHHSQQFVSAPLKRSNRHM